VEADGTVIDTYIRGGGLIRSWVHGYYVFNARGDVVQITNAIGWVIRDYEYDAFGIQLGGGNPNEPDTNPWRFTGEYLDIETGMVYLRHRFYNPLTGRFITEDPFWGVHNMQSSIAAIRQSTNLYVYVMNNPMMFIDPSGLAAVFSSFNAMINDASRVLGSRQTELSVAWSRTRQADGSWGYAWSRTFQERLDSVWDNVTRDRIETLHPFIRNRTVDFILSAQDRGINLRITEGYRSVERQNELFNQGRSTPGSIVTNARGGQSNHNFGLAFDVVQIRDGVALWNNDNWSTIGAIGRRFGFTWGGDWTGFVDRPHFEFTGGYTLSELNFMHSGRDFIGGSTYLNLDISRFNYNSPADHPMWRDFGHFQRAREYNRMNMF